MSELDLSNVKVGTRVKLRNGDTDVIIVNDGSDVPVCLKNRCWGYCRNGDTFGCEHEFDIVEVLTDEPKTDFPTSEVVSDERKTLRDEIAIEAMKSLMTSEKMMGIVAHMNGEIHDNISKLAYYMAHAMMKARNGK